MNRMTKGYVFGLAAALSMAVAGCGGSGGASEEVQQPPQPAQPGTGYLNLSVSDAPIKDATKVCIKFDGVRLKKADEDAPIDIDFFDENGDPAPVVVNLLSVQGANSHPIVTGEEVPAGTYEWIRLKVQAERGMGGGADDPDYASELCDETTENSYLVRSETELYNLYIPSGSQRGLQLIKDIVIPINSSGDYTAEWDLGKSFNAPPGQSRNGNEAMMKPVVKLVANNEVGTLVGQVADEFVDPELADPETCDVDFAPSVYVFDDGVMPNAIDDPAAEDDAVATGLVQFDDDTEQWRYSIGFLLAGNYEAAYTCNGMDFIPLDGKPAEIFVGEVTTVDFVTDDEPGTLAGQVAGELVDPDLVDPDACDAEFEPAVYVFDDDVAPNPLDEPPAEDDAVATGPVLFDDGIEQWRYSIQLAADNYRAAFTCNGNDFVPVDGKPAEILPGEETTLDFDADDVSTP